MFLKSHSRNLFLGILDVKSSHIIFQFRDTYKLTLFVRSSVNYNCSTSFTPLPTITLFITLSTKTFTSCDKISAVLKKFGSKISRSKHYLSLVWKALSMNIWRHPGNKRFWNVQFSAVTGGGEFEVKIFI